LRIVLTHIGNPIPEYVKYSLEHLRRNNQCDVDFILDQEHFNDQIKSMFQLWNINPVFSDEFKQDPEIVELNEKTWIKKKHPLGPPTTYKSQDNFWHLTMERLFYLSAYINSRKLENVLHIENDNVLFYNVESLTFDASKINCVYRHHSGEDSTLFSFAIIPHYSMMLRLCKFMNLLVSAGEEKLQQVYGFDHISEMHLLTVYRKCGNLTILPIMPNAYKDYVFDPFGYAAYIFGTNNFQPPGFYDTSDSIGRKLATLELTVEWDKQSKTPFVYCNGEKYKIFNLHMHRKNIEDLL
jgi:hypothetical protein